MAVKDGLLITVHGVKGHCPVYKTGDRFFLREGYVIDTRKSGNICMHSLSSIMPYHVALSHGVEPSEIGLAGPDGAAYVQCLDPCEITDGGTVTFKIERK